MVLSSEDIRKHTSDTINSFKNFFSVMGYIEHTPVGINSKIDESVYFVGSTISVFKKYILTNTIPLNGYYLSQRCIRTQNINLLYKDEIPNWASYFTAIGTISRYDKLEDVSHHIWHYLNRILNIKNNDILVKVSSKDDDLLKIWNSLEN